MYSKIDEASFDLNMFLDNDPPGVNGLIVEKAPRMAGRAALEIDYID